MICRIRYKTMIDKLAQIKSYFVLISTAVNNYSNSLNITTILTEHIML